MCVWGGGTTLERDGEEADLSPSSVDHRTYQLFNTLISVKSPPTFGQESSAKAPPTRPWANGRHSGPVHRSGTIIELLLARSRSGGASVCEYRPRRT